MKIDNQYKGVISIDKFITRYLDDILNPNDKLRLTNASLVSMDCSMIFPIPNSVAKKFKNLISEGKILLVIDKRNVVQAYLSPSYLKMLNSNISRNNVIANFERSDFEDIRNLLLETIRFKKNGGNSYVKKYKRR